MTTISIVGAGNVARGIATRAIAAGYGVQLLVRDQAKGEALASELGGNVTVSTVGSAIVGELVFLAIPYLVAAEVIPALGTLTGKTIVDATNPINDDFTGLATTAGTSGAEVIAALVPGANVVKAFNTVFASNVIAGNKNGQPLDLMVAADDADSKAKLVEFAEKTGFRVIDTGALGQAETLEAIAWLHMQLQFTRGTNFASAIVIVD
jgi:predicted dinucleotide-binding enzyme